MGTNASPPEHTLGQVSSGEKDPDTHLSLWAKGVSPLWCLILENLQSASPSHWAWPLLSPAEATAPRALIPGQKLEPGFGTGAGGGDGGEETGAGGLNTLPHREKAGERAWQQVELG